MFTKLLSRNASFALIVLFATISLFPMDLSAEHHGDHDNRWIPGVLTAQTSLGIVYSHPYVYSGSYATVANDGNGPIRYYWSDELAAWRRRAKNPTKRVFDSDDGTVNPGEWLSFLPYFSLNMTGYQGVFLIRGDVELGLKYGNGKGATVRSSAEDEITMQRK
ncbi:MAG: hypothetical protein OXI43_20660 [Candidatus Poribacteria bacterium]|nr:hypothetical protein [Candidatus Poribacteria bacterium]